jgi:hypothetical protein
MSVLAPTRAEDLLDREGRPYFLWDDDMSLQEFRTRLTDADDEVRAYFIGKLMRQAKPDDVFTFVSLSEIERLWESTSRYLGHTRDFWTWLLAQWRVTPHGAV